MMSTGRRPRKTRAALLLPAAVGLATLVIASPAWARPAPSVVHASVLSAAGTLAVLCLAAVAAAVLVAGAVLLSGRPRREPADEAVGSAPATPAEKAAPLRRAAA